jgi:hypothetical protein
MSEADNKFLDDPAFWEAHPGLGNYCLDLQTCVASHMSTSRRNDAKGFATI